MAHVTTAAIDIIIFSFVNLINKLSPILTNTKATNTEEESGLGLDLQRERSEVAARAEKRRVGR